MKKEIRLESLSKKFPGVVAIDNLDLSLRKGKIFGLVGENGSGKSTLVKTLMGIHKPDKGNIYMDEEKIEIKSPYDAQRKFNITGVYQEDVYLDNLDIMDNMFLASKNKKSSRDRYRTSKDRLKSLGADFDPTKIGSEMSRSERALVNLARCLEMDPDLIFLDEITSCLESKEVEEMFDIMRNLRKKGKIIIFISHILSEVLQISDEIIVLKDGKLIRKVSNKNLNEKDLIGMMTGKKIGLKFPKREPPTKKFHEKNEILYVQEIADKEGEIRDVSLKFRSGEISAVVGLRGSGASKLLKMICGLVSRVKGNIYVGNKKLKINSIKDAIENKIWYIPSEHVEGIWLSLPLLKNTNMPFTFWSGKIFFGMKEQTKLCRDIASQFEISPFSPDRIVLNLSGGNKQKVQLAKLIPLKPRIIVIDEPTKGIDVAVKQRIYGYLRNLAREGLFIILRLVEMPEVLNLPDRIFVMSRGKIKVELPWNEVTEKKVLAHYFGE